jgi:hypothetical protein
MGNAQTGICIHTRNRAALCGAHASEIGPNGIVLVDDYLIVDVRFSGLQYRVNVQSGEVRPISYLNVEAVYGLDGYMSRRISLTLSSAAHCRRKASHCFKQCWM